MYIHILFAIYVVMSLGSFAAVLMLRNGDGDNLETFEDIAGLSSTRPGIAWCLAALMFSLAGIPPLMGFFAKLGVWQAGVDAGLVWLVVASAVASAIGAYYYLRIVFLMYFGAEGDDRLDEGKSSLLSGFVVASAVIMVVGILNMFGVETAAISAAATLIN